MTATQRLCCAWLLTALLLAAQPSYGLRVGSTLGAYVAPFLAALGPDVNHSHKCRPSQVSEAGDEMCRHIIVWMEATRHSWPLLPADEAAT